MRLVMSLLGMSFLCVQVLADELDLSLNANALRAQYFHEFETNQLSVDGGWLYHEDNGNAVHVGLHLIDIASSGRDRVEAGIGGRIVYTNGDSSRQNGFAVPLGGFVRVTPRAMTHRASCPSATWKNSRNFPSGSVTTCCARRMRSLAPVMSGVTTRMRRTFATTPACISV